MKLIKCKWLNSAISISSNLLNCKLAWNECGNQEWNGEGSQDKANWMFNEVWIGIGAEGKRR